MRQRTIDEQIANHSLTKRYFDDGWDIYFNPDEQGYVTYRLISPIGTVYGEEALVLGGKCPLCTEDQCMHILHDKITIEDAEVARKISGLIEKIERGRIAEIQERIDSEDVETALRKIETSPQPAYA